MDYPLGFAISLILVIAGMSVSGIPLLKSLTLSIEGHREFKGDSMTRREKTRGWVGAVVWSIFAIIIWTFFVDWFRAGNIDFATEAFAYRIEKLAEAAARS